jgi:hypothetical protein
MSPDVTQWIDVLAGVWDINDGRGGTLRSYRLYERDEFPNALVMFPCAITIPQGLRVEYSAGGPALEWWTGITEFHLSSNVDKNGLPYVLSFVRKIQAAAAGNMSLGGRVEHFLLSQEGDAIRLATLQYGGEDPHLGLVVSWMVKVSVSGEFEVA